MKRSFLRAIPLGALLMLCSGAASSQTVAELAERPEAQQRAAITALTNGAMTNLMSKTDRNTGKPKSAQEIEQQRLMAHMIQAFFTPNPLYPDEPPPGFKSILIRIRKGSTGEPSRTLADVLTDFVDAAFEQFWTKNLDEKSKAIWSAKNDEDQVRFFRLTIQLYLDRQANDRIIKKLQEQQGELEKKMTQMQENTVVLPDGRYVFRAKNGDMMATSGFDGPETKLTGADRQLAERLADCKAQHHIKSGKEALEACRSEVGLGRASSVAAVKNEFTDPKDDPFGGDGGFIHPAAAPDKPASEPSRRASASGASSQRAANSKQSVAYNQLPASFDAMVCVPKSLVDQGWNKPAPGSKMEAFESQAAEYISAIAQPSWQYRILEQQYATYDSTATYADQYVAKIAPDSGSFDLHHPQCRTSEAEYTIKIDRK